MARALWKASWKGNSLQLVLDNSDLCLVAYKNKQTLHKWCLDSELSKKINSSLDSLLSGTSMRYVHPDGEESFGMSIEGFIRSFFFFEFCKGNNFNRGANCITLVTSKAHLKKLQRTLSQVGV